MHTTRFADAEEDGGKALFAEMDWVEPEVPPMAEEIPVPATHALNALNYNKHLFAGTKAGDAGHVGGQAVHFYTHPTTLVLNVLNHNNTVTLEAKQQMMAMWEAKLSIDRPRP